MVSEVLSSLSTLADDLLSSPMMCTYDVLYKWSFRGTLSNNPEVCISCSPTGNVLLCS